MERSVRAILRAETGPFEAGMDRAAKATERVGTAAQDSARKSEQATRQQTSSSRTFSQRLVENARENEQAWNGVRNTLAVTATGIAGLATVVGKTGISYNQLRQQSVAALTTLTGSAEGANAQMDRMDEFARNSPFARQVFLQAQTQLLGFGMEAERVVPTLDAIQNAVAATGGSNQDIAELATIIAQVGATGKISARDLQMFGYRGVDAADIIGEQFGKTGAEIRESITRGTIDADAAILALTDGMQERFGGAAANVKETYAGAVDRVSAAFRDLSANLMSPLVDPQGGGLLVGWLNNLADAMRAFEGLPDGVQYAAGALIALTGAAAGLGAVVMWAVPQYDKFFTNLETVTSARFAGGLRTSTTRMLGWGTAVGIAAVAVGAIATALNQASVARDADEIARSIENVADAGGNLRDVGIDDIMSEIGRVGAGDFAIAKVSIDNLGDSIDALLNRSFTDNVSQFVGAFSPLGSYMDEHEKAVKSVDEALAQMVTEGNIVQVMDQLAELGLNAEDLAEIFPNASSAIENAGQTAGESLPAWQHLTDGLYALAEGAGDAAAKLTDTETAVKAAIDSLEEGEALDAGRFLDVIRHQTQAVIEFRDNYQRAIELIGEEVQFADRTGALSWLEEVMLDPDSAPLVMDLFVNMTPDERRVLLEQEAIQREVELELRNPPPQLIEGFSPEMRLNTEPAESDLVTFGQTAFEEPYVAMLSVNPESAHVVLNDFRVEVDETTGYVTIDGRPMPAELTLAQFIGDVDASTGTVDIDGHSLPAEMTLTDLLALIDGSEAISTILGDDHPAQVELEDFLEDVRASSAATNVGANTNPAQMDVLAWHPPNRTTAVGADMGTARTNVLDWAPPSRTAPIYANLNPAREAVRNWTPYVTARISALFGNATGGPIHGRSSGGRIHGPGTTTSDSIPAIASGGVRYMLSNDEHIWSAYETQMVGGHAAMEGLRSLARTGQLRAALDGAGRADGGRVSAGVEVFRAPAVIPRAASTGAVTATLAAEDRALLRAVASRPVQVQMGRRTLAEATQVAGDYGRARGQG